MFLFFFFKQKTAYEMRISDWSSDVCSSDLGLMRHHGVHPEDFLLDVHNIALDRLTVDTRLRAGLERLPGRKLVFTNADADYAARVLAARGIRSEEHTSELQSLMRNSYAVFCLKKNK